MWRALDFQDNWNVLRGRVEDYVILGSSATLTIDVGFPIKVTLSKRSFAEIGFLDEVWLAFDPTSVKIMRENSSS